MIYGRRSAVAQGMAAAQRPMPPSMPQMPVVPMLMRPEQPPPPGQGFGTISPSPYIDQLIHGTPNQLPDVTPRVTSGAPQPKYDPGPATSGGLMNALGVTPGLATPPAGASPGFGAAMGK